MSVNTSLIGWIHFLVTTTLTTAVITTLALLAGLMGLIEPVSVRETIVWSAIYAIGGNLLHVAWRNRPRTRN